MIKLPVSNFVKATPYLQVQIQLATKHQVLEDNSSRVWLFGWPTGETGYWTRLDFYIVQQGFVPVDDSQIEVIGTLLRHLL